MNMISTEYMGDVLGAPCTALKEFEIMEMWCELCEEHEHGECWKEMILRAENNRKIAETMRDTA